MLLFGFICFVLMNYVNGYIFEEECLNYTIYPVQYELTLIPYILSEDRFYYNCEITITVIANVPGVRVIELDAKDLEIKRDSVGVWFDNRNIIDNSRPYDIDKKAGKLYLYLKEELKQYGVQKNQYHIKMSFIKYLNYKENGIFLVRYNEKGTDRYLLSTRISPSYAKTVFPCFDNPEFEAVFKFRIYTLPPHMGLIYPTSSLVIAQETHRHISRDNYTIIEYISSPQISTYQVGIHLSNFISKQKTAQVTTDTIVVWAPSTLIHQYNYILNIAVVILNNIHSYSGIKRPITNEPINLVPLPTNIHGYERGSWNLLTNGDHKMSYITQFTSAKQKEIMSFELSQQLSRIWLGNPGEPERTRWKEEWFKEGLATYLGYYFLSQMDKSFWDMRTYGLQMRHLAMSIDWPPTVPALSTFNRTLAVLMPDDSHQLITTKTAALLWMVENWLGSNVFHKSLKEYIKDRRGKFISVDDFAEYLQKATVHCAFFKGYTVSNVLNTWIQQPGYPIVNVRVYRKPGDQDVVYLEQKHFTFNNYSRRDYKYLIPISYIAQYTDDCYNCFQPKFTIGNTGYTFKENLNNGWIILNRNASGYYRVNYDLKTWDYIIKTLKEPHRSKIDQYNRAQIVNDAFALYVAGEISLQLATDILDCLDKEDNYVVWEAAFSGFELLKIDEGSVPMSKAVYNYWKMFMREKVSIIYTRLINEFERDHQSRLFRSKVVTFACTVEHSVCVKDLEAEIQRIRYRQTYDPDLREICYYILLNRTYGWEAINGKRNLNRFEKEDASIAEYLSKRDVQFEFNLPNKNGPPMALTLSTTSSPEPTTTKRTAPLPAKPSAAAPITTMHLTVFLISLGYIIIP